MIKSVVLVFLILSFNLAQAYEAGCVQDPHFKVASIQINGDPKMKLEFSSVAACEAQMAYLKAQPAGIVCGCSESVYGGVLAILGLLGGQAGLTKGVNCFKLTYDDAGRVAGLEQIKIKDNHPKFYRLAGQPAKDESVAKECVEKEASLFTMFKSGSEILAPAVESAQAQSAN